MSKLPDGLAAAITTYTCRARYEALVPEREPFLRRARECAEVTIPSLLPREGASGHSDLPTPFQSIGARGVNHLSSKLALALFPPESAFFRLTMDDFVRDELAERARADGVPVQDAFAEFETALSKIEQAVTNRIEQLGMRSRIIEALRQLVNAGNAAINVTPEGKVKVFRLDRFVVKRNADGDLIEIIIKESFHRASLDQDILDLLAQPEDPQVHQGTSTSEEVDVFTRVHREGKTWKLYQEVEDQQVPGSTGSYPLGKLPWFCPTFNRIDGEDYGRGHCEQYLGDLLSLESLSRSLVQGAAAAARILYFVDETGLTSKEDVAAAANGGVVDGNAKDVTVLQLDKYADFRVALEKESKLEQRLSAAFLLFSELPRQAERVTAEEIRRIAAELEDSLGGVYSVLAEELQKPLASAVMAQMQKKKEIPALPEGAVRPKIVTGMDALGRNHDLLKLEVFVQDIGTTFGPEAVQEYINIGAFMKRKAAALAMDIDGLVRSEEEVQEAREAAQAAEMAGKLGGPAMDFIGDRMSAGEAQAPTPEGAPA